MGAVPNCTSTACATTCEHEGNRCDDDSTTIIAAPHCDEILCCGPQEEKYSDSSFEESKRKTLLNSSLVAAARKGDVQAVEELIMKGARLESRRPLVLTASHGEENSINVVDPRFSVEGLTPLMHAVRSGNEECVRVLIEAKAKVDAQEEDGLRPLHFAAMDCNFGAAMALLEGGADPGVLNDDDQTALDLLGSADNSSIDIKAWHRLFEKYMSGRSSSSP